MAAGVPRSERRRADAVQELKARASGKLCFTSRVGEGLINNRSAGRLDAGRRVRHGDPLLGPCRPGIAEAALLICPRPIARSGQGWPYPSSSGILPRWSRIDGANAGSGNIGQEGMTGLPIVPGDDRFTDETDLQQAGEARSASV